MIQRQGQYDAYPYTLERYESIDEFLKAIESRPLVGRYQSKSSGLRDEYYYRRDFTGATGYTDAKTQFVNGTKAKTEMSSAFKSELDPRKREIKAAPCGCVPIVANALMGLPNSMIDVRHARKPKATKVIVNMSINGGTSGWQITEAGKKIMAAVGKLESQGIATEITCTADKFLNCSQLSSCGITIKNAGQAFNAARVSFSMSSPAFLRVFQWLQLSTNPHAQYDSGYGANVAYTWRGDKLADYYRTMYGNGIYISLPDVVRRGQAEIDRAIEEWQKRR